MSRVKAQADDVGFIDEQYVTLALDPTVAVIEAVDGGVVLIVGTHRLHDQIRHLPGFTHTFVQKVLRQPVGLEVS
ncbi:hypothetical protein D3C72_1558090 [compost metagenome]